MDTVSSPSSTQQSMITLIDKALAVLQHKTGIANAGLVLSMQDDADTPGLAPPLLVYADLMALLDPRAQDG